MLLLLQHTSPIVFHNTDLVGFSLFVQPFETPYCYGSKLPLVYLEILQS